MSFLPSKDKKPVADPAGRLDALIARCMALSRAVAAADQSVCDVDHEVAIATVDLTARLLRCLVANDNPAAARVVAAARRLERD